MKRKSFYSIPTFFVAAVLIFAACTKEMSEVRLDPTLSTSQTLNITSDSATVVGFVVAEGNGFTEKGVCYNTETAPTISNNKVAYSGTGAKATFNVTLTGLNYATKYYARAYATGDNGTVYGEEVTFTTKPVVPMLTTADATDVTGNSATSGGNVTGSGGADVTARGVCYGISENPTIAGDKTTDDKGTGAFVSSLTGLKGNTTYYARAYATNSAGTGYGQQVSFKTPVDVPAVTTADVINVTKTGAISGGNVTYDGGGEVTARGLAWGTSENPTINDNMIDGGTGTGVFVSTLDGLDLSTTYHVRAYATNSAGTAYGADISFTTLADITKFWVVGDYNGWDNTDNAKFILSTATSNGLAEGYVYLTQGGIKLVTDHSWDNAHTYGDDGSGGLTNPGGNISVPADGYYLIHANLSDMTYSLLKVDWGVIGDATPNGWNDETPLTYDANTGTWNGGIHLTAATIKFRANHSWDYNFGSDNADGTLQAGGANIAVDTEDDYAITLDLSHPNEYTYSINRWGLIGDATPDSWNSDQNMTWDATNHVFSITLDLTAGAIKFRANDGWDVNYGGDLNALTPGGDNIPIGTAGNYTITFDPWGLKATVTMN